MSRGGDVAASPAPATPPGQVSAGDEALLAPLLDAFDALGLKRPKLTGFEPRDAAELLQHFEPLTIARCWQDIAAGAWGDEWDRRHLSFKLLASHNRLENWQREREADAVVADDLVGDVDVVRV